MIRVLHVAHSRQVSEGKIERLRLQPDLRVHLVRPGPRRRLDGAHVVPVWRRPDPHRCFYGTLTFGIPGFRPDIIHVEEEPDSLAALQVCLAARACAPSAFLVYHTWQNLCRPMRPLVRALVRTTLGHAGAVLCASPEAEQVIRSLGFAGQTRPVLPQGVDMQVFRRHSPRPPGHVFSVGFVGRLVPEKGCSTLLEAVAKLGRPCTLTLVGDGPDAPRLRRLAGHLRVPGVRFAGQLGQRAAAEAICSFDVLVLPSLTTPVWKEQFGRVLAEAMACEVPVVGSDSGAIPWVIGDAGLVFAEGDAGALASALRRLHDDPASREALGSRGRRRAEACFSEDRLAEETARFYREVANGMIRGRTTAGEGRS